DNISVGTLNDGTITYTATATDSLNQSGQATTTAPKTTIFITSVTSPINNANKQTVSISGTGQPHSQITLTATDGTTTTNPAVQVMLSGDGSWTVANFDTSGLLDGPITFIAASVSNPLITSQKTVTKDTVAPDVGILVANQTVNLSNLTDLMV